MTLDLAAVADANRERWAEICAERAGKKFTALAHFVLAELAYRRATGSWETTPQSNR